MLFGFGAVTVVEFDYKKIIAILQGFESEELHVSQLQTDTKAGFMRIQPVINGAGPGPGDVENFITSLREKFNTNGLSGYKLRSERGTYSRGVNNVLISM